MKSVIQFRSGRKDHVRGWSTRPSVTNRSLESIDIPMYIWREMEHTWKYHESDCFDVGVGWQSSDKMLEFKKTENNLQHGFLQNTKIWGSYNSLKDINKHMEQQKSKRHKEQ